MKLFKFFNLSLCAILLFSFETVAQRKNKNQKSKISYDKSLYSSLKFREIGPFRGGRSCAVTGVEGNANLFYFGSTGGGVWKTTDGGKSYENISDGYFGGSIGAVAVSKSDPNVIYVGGGEVTVRGNVSSGYGIWKSEDAGETWKSCGLPKSRHIPRIVIDPQNPDIVYAAVLGNIYKPTSERGVYKSTNGGKTWSKILFESNHAGAVELVIDPNNPRNLYAATWRVKRTPYSLSSGGEGSILWKSTDRGNNWEKISGNQGFAKGILGIIGVTVSPVNSNRVWAIVENKESGGVYRSDDGGETWSHVNDSRALRQRAWYYSKIYADTEDINKVYVMNVSYHKSTDGGETFTSHNAPHGDHHDLWIAPENSNRMIIGDDGGAQITYDGGETWSTYHNQPTAQFYRVTTDNSFPYRIYAAQQDNSTIRINHRSDGSYIDESDWEPSAGGESAHIAIDPNDNDIVYGGSYGGYLTRVNHKTNSERGINVWPDNPMGYGAKGMKYRFQWNFPVFFSPHSDKKMYAFSNHVHVTENEGQSWEIISPDLTRNVAAKLKSSGGPITQDNTGVEYYCTLFAGGESNIKNGLIWVGSDDGLIHLTKDGGKTWTNVTPKNMPEWMMINSIDPSPFDPGTCYVAGTKYKTGDFKPYLYRTEDYGETWELITNNIKNENFTRVLRADPARKGLLYAGTESGLYISFDDGNSWKPFQQNLPVVPVTDLTIKDNSLIVATQGRSLWMIDDLTVLHQLPSSNLDPYLFKPKATYRLNGSGGKKSLTMGTNKPNGVAVHFFIPKYTEGSDTIELSFHDEKGNEIKKFSTSNENSELKVKEGGNVFVWDYKYPGAEKFEGMIMWSASLSGAKAVPGTYQVRLSVNNFESQNSFEIMKSPTSESSVDQMREQFTFVNQINKTISKAHQSIEKIRRTKLKLNEFLNNFSDNKDAKNIVSKANFLIDSLSTVENALYQTKNESRQDPLNFPIKLTNKLGHIANLVTMNDFPPTDQDKRLMMELSEKIDKEIEIFNKLITNDVSEFNLSFKKLKFDYLIN